MKKSTSTKSNLTEELFVILADTQYTLSQLRKRRKQGKFLTLAESKRLIEADKQIAA
jgi:hypothetical protein